MVTGDLVRARSAATARPWPRSWWCAGRQRVEHQQPAGRVLAEPVAEHGVHERLVHGEPHRDPVPERRRDQVGVLAEAPRGLPVQPAAAVFEGLRQIPVVQRDDRVDAAVQQRVDQPVVERHPARVGRAGAVGLDPRPRHRQVVGVHAQPGHQRHVLAVAVVVVAGHVTGRTVGHPAGLVGERVPHRDAGAVLGGGAFHLVRGGGHAPDKPLGYDHGSHCSLSSDGHGRALGDGPDRRRS